MYCPLLLNHKRTMINHIILESCEANRFLLILQIRSYKSLSGPSDVIQKNYLGQNLYLGAEWKYD